MPMKAPPKKREKKKTIKLNSRKNGAIKKVFNCCMSCRDCSNSQSKCNYNNTHATPSKKNRGGRGWRSGRGEELGAGGGVHTTLDGPNIFVLNAINCDIIFLCNRKRNRGRKKRYTKYYSWPRNALKSKRRERGVDGVGEGGNQVGGRCNGRVGRRWKSYS